jgi:hypothetical protein
MNKWQRQLGILFLFKIIYLLVVAGMVLLFPAAKNSPMGHVEHVRWTTEGHPTFESYFTTWDAGHYLYLSEHGYHAGHEQCAFYPLWPLLIRWFSIATGGDHIISGMILANGFSLAGFFIFFRLVAKRLGEPIAWRSVALLAAFPGSLFFQFIYSESLFFFLVMLLCFALEENLLSLAFVSALLLPMTRAVGIFCVLPIAIHLVARWSRQFALNTEKRFGLVHCIGTFPHHAQPDTVGTVSACTIRPANLWLPVAPFYGWAVYFVLMWRWTGNPFEGFEAQRFWGCPINQELD